MADCSPERAQSILFRMHAHDKALLLKLLADDKMTYQSFATACMDAYLRGDPGLMAAIKDWKTLREIPKEHQDKYTLSYRERAKILDDIANVPVVLPVPGSDEK